MSQRLGKRFRARGRADYFSDITVQQTYNQNIYDTSRRSRVYSGSVTGTVGTWNLSGAFDRNEFFYGTTQSTVRGGTPRISAQRSDKPLFGSPAYFSMAVEGAKFTAQRKTATTRRRQRALAVRHLPARAPAVHEVAVPHGLDHRRGPLHLLDRAEGHRRHVAQPRRPDQPQLLRAGGAGEPARPSTESGIGPAASTPRRSSTPSSRTSTCSASRRSTTSPSSCRSTAWTRSSARSPA